MSIDEVIQQKHRICNEKYFAKQYPKEYAEILNMDFPYDFSFSQKLYHYINQDIHLKLGICHCGKRCNYKNLITGYRTYCSIACRSTDETQKEKRVKTCLDKYGTNSPMQNETVKQKTKQTCLDKYGVTTPLKSECVKQKIKQTNLEKYGVENPAKNKTVQEKIKQTCLDKYGVTTPLKSECVKQKIKQTNLEKYGVGNSMQSKQAQEKFKMTCLKKYGVEYPTQCNEIKNKMKCTFNKNYGVSHPMKSDKVKEKTKQTNLEKYGVEHPMQSETIKEKTKQTNLEKYGVEHPMQSETIKEKTKQTNLEKYGVTWSSQSDEIKQKIKQTNIKKYGNQCALSSEFVKEKIKETNLEKYGVPYACMRPEARCHSNDSKPNQKFAKLLNENDIKYEREFYLEKYSYDFKIDNILIEINPSITHNSHTSIFDREPTKSDYHINKSNCAKEHEFQCIHIWDWDDVPKIMNMLKPKKTLYARNLALKEVPKKDCDEFLNEFHLQNTCKGQKIRYGLYKDDLLVMVMTFGKPRYNKKYELELLRLCSHKDYKIVGGAEKIFKYILDKFKPENIISYCDNSKFSGEVYVKLGFAQYKSQKPSKHWYNPKSKQHITDNLLRQRGFDQLFDTDYGKGTSNEELMIEYNFLPVYDAGQTTYVWFGSDSSKRKEELAKTTIERTYKNK